MESISVDELSESPKPPSPITAAAVENSAPPVDPSGVMVTDDRRLEDLSLADIATSFVAWIPLALVPQSFHFPTLESKGIKEGFKEGVKELIERISTSRKSASLQAQTLSKDRR